MKNLKILLALALMSVLLVSCGKVEEIAEEEVNVENTEDEILVEEDSVSGALDTSIPQDLPPYKEVILIPDEN